jgi:hypothetical protein
MFLICKGQKCSVSLNTLADGAGGSFQVRIRLKQNHWLETGRLDLAGLHFAMRLRIDESVRSARKRLENCREAKICGGSYFNQGLAYR